MADLYREKVERLVEELNRPELRAEAAKILRSLIDEIRLIPENGRLEIELTCDPAGILALANGRGAARINQPVSGGDGLLKMMLVAGEGCRREYPPLVVEI